MSLSPLQRPPSDPAYLLLVLARSLDPLGRSQMDDCQSYLPSAMRELIRHIVSPMTGVTLEASLNGDVLNETLVQVPDGSVILVHLSDGFSETIQKALQRFLDRQVNLFHPPPKATGDTDVCLKAFVLQGQTCLTGFSFACHTVFTHWRSTLLATAQKHHPGSEITESHLFPAHVSFESLYSDF